MNILFLQGPNLNLLGLQSSKINKDRLTLCKLNRHLKKYLRNTPHKIKIFQTHKEFQAINYLQRNRNWSDGHLIIPTTWSINNCTLVASGTQKFLDAFGGIDTTFVLDISGAYAQFIWDGTYWRILT